MNYLFLGLDILKTKLTDLRSRENVLKLQKRRQYSIIEHCLRHSEFYKDIYSSYGIKLSNYQRVPFEEYPSIDKKTVMDNFDLLVTDKSLKKAEVLKFLEENKDPKKKYKNKYTVIHSSGTSGFQGVFVYGPKDWSKIVAVAISRVNKAPVNLLNKTKLLFLIASEGHYAGVSLVSEAPNILFDNMIISINKEDSVFINEVNQFNPQILGGYASGIYELAIAKLNGELIIKPKRILCSAEPLTMHVRKSIKKAFNIEPVNFYAASESLCMGAECEYGRMHFFDDYHIFEIEDNKLVLTNLYNYTMPLIRYKISDGIVFEHDNCKCGMPYKVVKKILGRHEDVLCFVKPDGTEETIHYSVFTEFFVEGLLKYQIMQNEDKGLIIKAVTREDKDKIKTEILQKLNEILERENLAHYVKCEVVFEDDIANDKKTGKYRLIIPCKNV